MSLRRMLSLVSAVAALCGGCALGSPALTHAGSASAPLPAKGGALEIVRVETYRGHGIVFTYPASWRYRRRGFFSTMTSPVVDLASQPTSDPCTRRGCWFPVRHLRPGAVVVMWEVGGGIIPSHLPPAGVHVRVLPRGCRALGGEEELLARVVLRDGRIYAAAACLRGPDLAAHEGEVRAMFASARTAAS
jgi:hypothetical protein